jgi:acyl-CoA dehydrogenase
MRLVGAAERGMNMMVERALSRTTFGKRIAQHGSFQSDLAKVPSNPLWFTYIVYV